MRAFLVCSNGGSIFFAVLCATFWHPASSERSGTGDAPGRSRLCASDSNSDKPALDRLLDADFTWTTADGKSLTKSELVRNPPMPAITDETAAQVKTYSYGQLGDVQANLGRAHVLRVWSKRSGVWKAIAYQEVSRWRNPVFRPGAGKDCENPCKRSPTNPGMSGAASGCCLLETGNRRHGPQFSGVFDDGG